jgi:hypothetical protein
MASSTPTPATTTEAASAAMRHIASDVSETIAQSRELIQQARAAMVRVNLIPELDAGDSPNGPRF